MEHKNTVKNGYNAIANQYLETRIKAPADMQLLDKFIQKLPEKAQVLDAGCSASLPFVKAVSKHFLAMGVDFSETMLEEIGFSIVSEKIVLDEAYTGKHLFVLEQKESLSK